MATADDWDPIEDLLLPEEVRLASCHGWAPGGLVDDEVDHPCVVYLTSESVMIDVRPQTLLEKPPATQVHSIDVIAWGAEKHSGGLRFMLLARPPVSEELFADVAGDEAEVNTVAVDLPKESVPAGWCSMTLRRALVPAPHC